MANRYLLTNIGDALGSEDLIGFAANIDAQECEFWFAENDAKKVIANLLTHLDHLNPRNAWKVSAIDMTPSSDKSYATMEFRLGSAVFRAAIAPQDLAALQLAIAQCETRLHASGKN